MLKWMIAEGYGDPRTIERRIANMEAWLEAPPMVIIRDLTEKLRQESERCGTYREKYNKAAQRYNDLKNFYEQSEG